jgi:hypothetical protein
MERRDVDIDFDALVAKWNERAGAVAGRSLRPLQALALEEAARVRGGLFPLGVGQGKTLVSLLLPLALGVEPESALVLLPAALKAEHLRERATYASWFTSIRPVPVWSYELFSRPESATALEDAAPALIIADEAHCLRSKDAARTKRFLRYFRGHQATSFVAMSGSLQGSSIHDWAHLAALALRSQSPLPMKWPELDCWARVLDPKHVNFPTEGDRARYHRRLDQLGVASGAALDRFHDHTSSIVGLVRSEQGSSNVRVFGELWESKSPALLEAADVMRVRYVLPCGVEIEDPLRLSAYLDQLASGFYYKPVWEDGEPPRSWFYTRRDWLQLRAELVGKGKAGLDSPALVTAAVERGEFGEDAAGLLAAWLSIASDYTPRSEAVWLDFEPVDAALAWAESHGEGLIWNDWEASREVVEPNARPGERPSSDICAVSIKSHGTGLNLQRWAHNAVLSPPGGPGVWEQMLGRTVRAGQMRDVRVWVNCTLEGRKRLEGAKLKARAVEKTCGNSQILLTITWARR